MPWKLRKKLRAATRYVCGRSERTRARSRLFQLATSVAILGEATSGKTTFARNITQKAYPDSFDKATECYHSDITLVSKRVSCKHELSVHDTPGNLRDRFPYLYETIIHNSDTFILIFSLSSSKGISTVTRTLNDIKSIKGKQVPVLIVANKSDLESKSEEDIRKRFKFYRDLATLNIPSVEMSNLDNEVDYRKYLLPLLIDIEDRHDVERGKDPNITML